MKKLFIPVLCLLALAACSKEEPVAMQANPQPAAAPAPQPQENAHPTCNATYAENLRTCTPYTCQEGSSLPGGLVLVRSINGEENGKCVETVTPQPAQAAPQTEEANTPQTSTTAPEENKPSFQQVCRFSPQERTQMADYLQTHFWQDDTNHSPKRIKNPLRNFLQNGVCTATGFEPQKQSAITCTGTDSITVITQGEDGQEISQVVKCQNAPAPKAKATTPAK